MSDSETTYELMNGISCRTIDSEEKELDEEYAKEMQQTLEDANHAFDLDIARQDFWRDVADASLSRRRAPSTLLIAQWCDSTDIYEVPSDVDEMYFEFGYRFENLYGGDACVAAGMLYHYYQRI